MLLSDQTTAKFIDDNFVASWEMIREVPKVTIDFGGGKVLNRTLAGNTVMYVCNPKGQVVDAFPGVYTPADFNKLVKNSVTLGHATGYDVVRQFHDKPAKSTGPIRLQLSKGMQETPLLRRLQTLPPRTPEEKTVDRAALAKHLSDNPKELFQYISESMVDISKDPDATLFAARQLGVHKITDPEERAQFAIKLDSKINSTDTRYAIHVWFSSLDRFVTPAEAKSDLFKKLLHIDYDDPYLGLADLALPGTPNPSKATRK